MYKVNSRNVFQFYFIGSKRQNLSFFEGNIIAISMGSGLLIRGFSHGKPHGEETMKNLGRSSYLGM